MRSILIKGSSLALAAFVAGCASQPVTERLADRLEQAESLAGEPVRAVPFLRVISWEPLAEDRLIIHTRRNEAWLLDVQRPCRELEWARAISIPASGGTLQAGFDRVHVGHDRCRIERIRPVDAQAWRALRGGAARPQEDGGT